MSSVYADTYAASHGNDGNYRTYFHTAYGKVAWWAVDFGQSNSKVVTRVHVTHKDWGENGKYVYLRVKLTTSDYKMDTAGIRCIES